MSPTEAANLARLLRPAIGDERVLAAIASIPRERFVPADERDRAYENVALPIGKGQTISQPLVVARMLETLELKPPDRVFVVGDGSEGLPGEAPFDAINVAAATGDAMPEALERQLADQGRLVAPVGSANQRLTVTRRVGRRLVRRQLEPVQFVPLV